VLYTTWRGFTAASAQVEILDLESGETRLLIDNAASARYVPTGHLIFGRGGQVEVAPFDLERREVTGPSVPVSEPIFWDAENGVLHVAVSDTGILAFVPGGGAPQRQLVAVDHEGNQQPVVGSRRGYEYARFSPDGQRVATTISEFGEPNIWILDRTTGLQTRLAGDRRKSFASWRPDGKRIAFTVETNEPPASWSIFWQQPDSSDPPEPLVMAREPGEWFWPYSWSPDGKVLVVGQWSPGASHDIYYVSLDRGGEIQPFLTGGADERDGLISPDGQWIAYSSRETGRWAIYVQRFPEGGERHQVSAGGALHLVEWSPDGRKLYYEFENRMMEVGITTTPGFRAETPRALFDMKFSMGIWYYPEFHLSPDGEYFLLISPDETWGTATELNVVLNWFEELKRFTAEVQ
jgi:dipeptidyl aminopeptidase/acylaminoacyl peptidase